MAYEASGMENQEYRHDASRKMRSKEVMRNWIWGSDSLSSGLSSRFMTVRCNPFAPLHRNIELHQTGAPRSHGREHCRFETASALKRGTNVRRSPLAPSLTRPFTIGPALRDLTRGFATPAVTENFCIGWEHECEKVVEDILGGSKTYPGCWLQQRHSVQPRDPVESVCMHGAHP